MKEISEKIESDKENMLPSNDVKSVENLEDDSKVQKEMTELVHDHDLEISSEFSYTSGYRSSNSEILSEQSAEDHEDYIVGEVLETTINSAVEKVEQKLLTNSTEQGKVCKS